MNETKEAEKAGNFWVVKTISGYAGGLDGVAKVTCEINTFADTVEEVHCQVQLLPALLAERDALRCALVKCNLELRAMHSHYHSDCPVGCPFEDATNQARAALALST
jgi:hypothetical protein